MKLLLTIGLLLVGTVLLGCGEVNVRRGNGGYNQSAAQMPADNRPAGELQKENAQLRQQLSKLEEDNNKWQAAVDARKEQLKSLERQRDQVEKDRNRYKKAMERDE